MKIMKMYILVIIFGLFSASAVAECQATGCIGIGDEVVKSVYVTSVHGEGAVLLQSPAQRDNLNCKLLEGTYMTLKESSPLFQEKYSLILTALSTGKKLHVRIVENSSDCEVFYVRMY